MAEKKNEKKVKAPRKIRKMPNINLLRHLNAVLVLAGFLFSFVVIGVLSTNSMEKYDVRSRGQVLPTVTPSATPSPAAISPTIYRQP